MICQNNVQSLSNKGLPTEHDSYVSTLSKLLVFICSFEESRVFTSFTNEMSDAFHTGRPQKNIFIAKISTPQNTQHHGLRP